MSEYLLLAAVVFAVNLMPAFGPPTWSVLVFFALTYDLHAVALVPLAAACAASARLILAGAARRLRSRFSEARRRNLDAAEEALTGHPLKALGGLALFALSPVPSAQLFVAAGLLTVRLVPITLVFFAGRLVSYSLYVGAASLARDDLGDIFSGVIASPVGVAVQIVLLAGLVALLKADWTKVGSAPRPWRRHDKNPRTTSPSSSAAAR